MPAASIRGESRWAWPKWLRKRASVLAACRQMSACVPVLSRTIASHPARGWLHAEISRNSAIGSAMNGRTREKIRTSKGCAGWQARSIDHRLTR
jgi:hypothetical protein